MLQFVRHKRVSFLSNGLVSYVFFNDTWAILMHVKDCQKTCYDLFLFFTGPKLKHEAYEAVQAKTANHSRPAESSHYWAMVSNGQWWPAMASKGQQAIGHWSITAAIAHNCSWLFILLPFASYLVLVVLVVYFVWLFCIVPIGPLSPELGVSPLGSLGLGPGASLGCPGDPWCM